MLEASFLLLTLGPLAAFIIWESYRHRRTSVKPLSRTSMERGFVPGAKTAERVCFIFAVAMAVFVVFLIIQPQHPPFAGRGAVFQLAFVLLVWSLGPAFICLVGFVSVRFRRSFCTQQAFARYTCGLTRQSSGLAYGQPLTLFVGRHRGRQ